MDVRAYYLGDLETWLEIRASVCSPALCCVHAETRGTLARIVNVTVLFPRLGLALGLVV